MKRQIHLSATLAALVFVTGDARGDVSGPQRAPAQKTYDEGMRRYLREENGLPDQFDGLMW